MRTKFRNPNGVAVDTSGNLYVTDYLHHAVNKIAPGGRITKVGFGFHRPSGVAVDATGNVYVADYGNNAVKKVALTGAITTVISGSSYYPTGVAVDSAGNVHVAGIYGVWKITPAGTITEAFSGFLYRYISPYGVADRRGRKYLRHKHLKCRQHS